MELFDRYAFNAFVIFNFEEKYSSDSSRKFLITHSNHLLLYDVLSLAFITFLFKFAVTESAQKLVNFLCRCAASTYPLCLCIHLPLIAFVFVSADIIFSSMWNTEIASTQSTWRKNLLFPGIYNWIWIYYTTNHWLSHNIFSSLTELDLNCPLLIFFFTSPILLGNNQKIRLNWKQNWTWGYGAENLKIMTFEGLSIEFLSIICYFGNISAYIFYKILKVMWKIN